MKVIHYRIHLLEPTLVTSLQGDPNSGVAFDYLPGSVLRGVLINKYLRSKSADTSAETLGRLFLDGTTRYLNGYPLDAYEHPSLPVPASWQHAKREEDTIFDFAIFDLAVEAPDDERQWQSVSAPFYTQSGDSVRLIRLARNIAVHTQRTARFGRAMPELIPANDAQPGGKPLKLLEKDEIPGAVYRYDALAAGQTFQAAIICDNDANEPILRPLIDGQVTLGGSRSGGYGRAELSYLPDGVARRRRVEDEEEPPEGKLIVTLHSNVLMRDEKGQFAVDPDLLCRVLSRHLQVDLVLKDAFLKTEMIGGFNRTWGLPLPQALAVRMGSVLVFKAPDTYDSTLLDKLEIRGIGERRAEGFGRIAFNQQRVEELTVDYTGKSPGLADFTLSEKDERGQEVRTLAKLMVDRMLRQHLDEALLARANELKIANPPSNAQISRLRSVVLEEVRREKPDVRKIYQFIKDLQARSISRRQFEHCTIDGVPLLRWLEHRLARDSEGVWMMDDTEWRNLLRISSVETDIRIGDVNAEINDDLRLEYVLRLIDLLLAHAAKQQRKEN
jgi:CRISPR-associated protein Csx10